MKRPIDYARNVEQWTNAFTGRDWLFSEVEDFLSSKAGLMLITGEPGIGKTAFAAQLVKNKNLLHHFINAQNLEWISPTAMIRSLSAQIVSIYGGELIDEASVLPQLNINMEIGSVNSGAIVAGVHIDEFVSAPVADEYLRMVIDPLRKIEHRNVEPILVVDGLEDAGAFSGKPTIADLILSSGANFPGKMILTSAHDRTVDLIERSFPVDSVRRVDIRGESTLNMLDCKKFVAAVIKNPPLNNVIAGFEIEIEETVDEICRRGEGNFLFLRTYLDEIKQSDAKVFEVDHIPRGLHQVYLAQLSRLTKDDIDKWFDIFAPVVGILSAARAPLTVEQLAEFSQLSRGQIQMAVKELGTFLDFTPDQTFSQRGFSLYHTALRDFILNPDFAEEFFLPAQAQHRKIADSVHAMEPDLSKLEDSYAIKNIAYHNRMAGVECYPRLFAIVDPEVQRSRRLKFRSDQIFRQDIAEAMLAAVDIGLPDGIIELVRCGLIDAGIVSKVSNVSPEILRELAQIGEWQRAIILANTGTGRTSEGLASIVSGILDSGREDRIDLGKQICRQIEGFGEDAIFAARAHAEVGNALAKNGDSDAEAWFEAGLSFIEVIPGKDERARILALIGRYWTAIDKKAGQDVFNRAINSARMMDAELDPDILDIAVSNNMAAQTTIQAEWSASQTPFDTLGAKARVLADVAAMLAAAEDDRAGEILADAESVAARIGGSGIEGQFARHTEEYINDRMQVVLGQAPIVERSHVRPQAELENQIEKSEKLARDQKGYFPRALIALARKLIPVDWKHAGEIMTRAEQAADHAEGGYRAQLLLELAEMRRQLGEPQAAEGLEQRAVQAANSQPDLLTGYKNWLANKGRQVAVSLREVASARHALVKGEFHSDQALANMALMLASQSTQDAQLLAEQIHDRSQKFRAFAGIAAFMEKSDAAKVVDAILEECSEKEDDFILLQSSDAIAGEYPALGKALADRISDPAKRLLAWTGLLEAFERGERIQILESAWDLSQKIDSKSAFLAEGLLRLGSGFLSFNDIRADDCYRRAISAVDGEPSQSNKAEILWKIAVEIDENDPSLSRKLLAECVELGRNLNGVRARGRILGKCAALATSLDQDLACRLLAEIRYLGRANFLDAVSQIVDPIVERYGSSYAWKLYGALQEAEQFS